MRHSSIKFALLLSVPAFGQQMNPNQVQGMAVVQKPTGNQTISMPSGATLTINSLNNIFNADTFTGTDIGAKISTGFASAACSSGCTIVIPPGNYSYSHTIQMPSKYDTLKGSGRGTTVLSYTGPGDGLYWTNPTFDVFDPVGQISDMTLIGNSTAMACVHLAGINGPRLENLAIGGCNGVRGVGIEFEDIKSVDTITRRPTSTWMERISAHNIIVGFIARSISRFGGNTTNVWFRNNGGTGSFDYSVFDFTMNVSDGGKGVFVDAGTDLYQVQLDVHGNTNPDNGHAAVTEALSVKGQLRYSTGQIAMETSGAGSFPNLIHVYKGGVVLVQGSAHILSSSGNGATLPKVDAGGTYEFNPYLDFGFPNGGGANNNIYPFVQRGAKFMTADGPVQISRGVDGIYTILWPDINSTFQEVTVAVNCTFGDPHNCQITTLNNQNRSCCGNIISNIRVLGGGTGDQRIPRLVVDIGNRNRNSQFLYVTHIGGDGKLLFPNDTLGPTVISTEGLTVRNASSSAANGLTWGGGASISSSTVIPQVGTPTVGKAACIKAVGPPVLIGFCSTAVDATGACRCN